MFFFIVGDILLGFLCRQSNMASVYTPSNEEAKSEGISDMPVLRVRLSLNRELVIEKKMFIYSGNAR